MAYSDTNIDDEICINILYFVLSELGEACFKYAPSAEFHSLRFLF